MVSTCWTTYFQKDITFRAGGNTGHEGGKLIERDRINLRGAKGASYDIRKIWHIMEPYPIVKAVPTIFLFDSTYRQDRVNTKPHICFASYHRPGDTSQ